MKKILGISVVVILLVVLLAGGAFSFYIGKSVFDGITNATPRETTVENRHLYSEEYEAFAETHNITSLAIPSSEYEHDIPAIYVDLEENKDVAVIIHGMGGTKESMADTMAFFLTHGFDVLAYDQRNSGENMAAYNTNGILESFDALDAVREANSRMPEDGRLLLYGESYGGATAAIALGRDESLIDYLILDCPVSNGMYFVNQIMEEIESEQGIPAGYMTRMGDLYCQMKLGFRFTAASPVGDYLADTHTPTLIFRSLKDTVTPPEMGKEIYDAIPHTEKILFTSENSAHVLILQEEPERYETAVTDFLEAYPLS